VKWLVDTNIISEIRKGDRCQESVAQWWSDRADEELFLSALSIGEIRKGIEAVRPRDAAKARDIETWLRSLTDAFNDRILPVDAAVAQEWGRISAQRPRPVIDALLAATAITHGMVLATRNTADVTGSGARLYNPFSPTPWTE
jgi:predicted nucleic acid-binding protein